MGTISFRYGFSAQIYGCFATQKLCLDLASKGSGFIPVCML